VNDPMCWPTRVSLASLNGGEELTGRRREHAATCLRCQAEAVKYRRLRRELAGLGGVVAPAPRGLVAAVLQAIERDPAQAESQVRRAGVAAAGAAAVVAAGTVVVLRRLRGAA
jgi:hypothetical protein